MEYPRSTLEGLGCATGLTLGGAIFLASSGATSSGASSPTYGYGVPLLALEWNGVSVGVVPRTGHASFPSTCGDPKTDHASIMQEKGGDPRTDHASLCAQMVDEMAATCSPYRPGELATQTATTDPASPGLNPDFAVSRSFELEFPEVRDGLPSIGEDPDFRDGLPSSGDFKGHAHPGAKVMNSSTDSETTAFSRIYCVAEKSEESPPVGFQSTKLARALIKWVAHWRARFDSAISYTARCIPHILMESLDSS